MAGVESDLDASGTSAEDSAANEESFNSGDEVENLGGNEAGENPAVKAPIEEVVTASLAKGIADCSITPDKRGAQLNGADNNDDGSCSDEEMAEEAGNEKPPKGAGEKAASGRPKFTEMIHEAMVLAGPSRSGVSVQQIKKIIHKQYPDLADKSDIYFRNGLKRLVDTGKLIQVTGTGASGSYKLVKPDKTKAAQTSKAPATSSKTASKAGPKLAATAKSAEAKKSSTSKSPLKSSGKSTKAVVSKTTVIKLKTATVSLKKMSNGSKSKIATANASPMSDDAEVTTKPRGRLAKPSGVAAVPRSPASKSSAAVSKSSIPSKSSAKARTDSAKSPVKPRSVAPKSPKPKSVAPKSPKPKSVAPKSPKPKSVAPKSPKPKSAAPKSPKRPTVVSRSPTPRTAAFKAKLDSASDDSEKTAPGPASKRGKK